MTKTNSKVNNQLTLQEFYKLTTVLKASKGFIKNNLPSKDDLLAELQKKLDFTITLANLQQALEATGIKWTKRSGTVDLLYTNMERKLNLMILAIGNHYILDDLKMPKEFRELYDNVNEESDDGEEWVDDERSPQEPKQKKDKTT